MILKAIYKKIYIFFLYTLIIIPILLILLFLRIFFKFNIVELETRAIGHFSLSVEVFLCEIHTKKVNDKIFYIWFPNSKISNYFLYKKWSEIINLGPRIILEKIFNLSNRFNFLGKLFLSEYRHWKTPGNENGNWQYFDIHNVLEVSNPRISFSNNEDLLGKKFLKSIGFENNKYICFFSRTGDYRKDPQNPHSIRNSSIYTQLKGIEKVCEKGFGAIRMSKVDKNNSLNSENPRIYDYSYSKHKSDFLDIYLLFNCSYMVSTPSGIHYIPIINRKKVLLVNYTNIAVLYAQKQIPIILPKKIINLATKKIVSYKEVFKKNLLNDDITKKQLNYLGYDYLDNSENEIYYAINEMHEYIINKSELKDFDLNNKFWDLYEDYYSKSRPKKTFISRNFLIKYSDLLN